MNACFLYDSTANRASTENEPPADTENRWKSLLYARFCRQTYPLTVFPEGIVPAASLWAGARLRVKAFREAGLTAGDRVTVSLPASPAFIQVLIAGIWEGLTLALLPPDDDMTSAIEETDARCGIGTEAGTDIWTPEVGSGFGEAKISLRAMRGEPTPETRFLLRSPGRREPMQWTAVSDADIFALLNSHLPRLHIAQARVLSVLPWHHTSGLVLDLLAALLSDAEIIREPSGGCDTDAMLALMDEHDITHLSAVPLTLQRLAAAERGRQALQKLRGGVICDAAVSGELAEFLKTTNLHYELNAPAGI